MRKSATQKKNAVGKFSWPVLIVSSVLIFIIIRDEE
jgi:hypothetical protein